MARGDVFEAEGEEYRDEETGALVRRLTGDGSDNHHLYFTSTSFVGDGEAIVFASDRSGGMTKLDIRLPPSKCSVHAANNAIK